MHAVQVRWEEEGEAVCVGEEGRCACVCVGREKEGEGGRKGGEEGRRGGEGGIG